MRILYGTLGLLLNHVLCTREEAQEMTVMTLVTSSLARAIFKDVSGYNKGEETTSKIYEENLTEEQKKELYLGILPGLVGCCDMISSKLRGMMHSINGSQQAPGPTDKDLKKLTIEILKAGIKLTEVLKDGASKPLFKNLTTSHADLFESKRKVLRGIVQKLKHCHYYEFAKESEGLFWKYIEANEWYYRSVTNWKASMIRFFKRASQNINHLDEVRFYPFTLACFFAFDSLIDLYFVF